MSIVILGKNGQVGSALQHSFVSTDVVALDRSQFDITSKLAVQQLFTQYSPQIIINATAYTAVDKAENEIDLANLVNREGVAMLADACAANKVLLVHYSTDYVFDGEKELPKTVNPTNFRGFQLTDAMGKVKEFKTLLNKNSDLVDEYPLFKNIKSYLHLIIIS